MAQQTELHVIGAPGKTHGSFAGKVEAVIPKGAGPFTALSVMGTPGMIHSFSAKTEAEVIAVSGYIGLLVSPGRLMN